MMSRTNKRQELIGNCNEGTSARTRPLSFEDIMLKRKKKLTADGKERTRSWKEQLVQNDVKLTSDQMDGVRTNKGMKELKDEKKESSIKAKGKTMKVKDGQLGSTYKHKLDFDVNEVSKSNYTSNRKDNGRMNEKKNNHRSRDDKMETSLRKDLERKQLNHSTEKDKHKDRERKPREEIQRKEHCYTYEKNRSETQYFSLRKFDRYDSQRLQYSEYAERNDRRKDASKPYFEEPKSKRRRSRSPEREREREPEHYRSSPEVHKHSYRGWVHEHSSFSSHQEKSRRKHSDGDKLITSGNDGYNASNHHKHGSGLGGYSPRKKRPEAPHRSPSPILPSQERKAAKWDHPPSEARNSGFRVMPSNDQTAFTKIQEPALTEPVTAAAEIPPHAPAAEIPSFVISASVDSVQLTQATRPMRRLYVENLPASASEKSVVDFLNDLLVSSGVNHIKGTSACINCILHKERNQALVEFLTPQDANSALTFDGRSFSGALLKFRRPKDFVEALTDAPEKEQEEISVVADIVRESPYKIFIGGISEDISSNMLKEIVGAYGNLKSYHFGFDKKLNGPCAFLEYEDHSITSKGCAGLNGMKLGGCILTVVQAFPDFEEKTESAPCYDIPAHAKPLLLPLTKVLHLKNVLTEEELKLFSESELEEILEDVRLECMRFGTVKEVNIVRYNNDQVGAAGVFEESCVNQYSVQIECRMEDPDDKNQHSQDLMPKEDIERAGGISNGTNMPLGESVITHGTDCSAPAIEVGQQVANEEIGQQLENDEDASMNEEIGLIPCSSSPKLGSVDTEIESSACLNNIVAEPAELTANEADGIKKDVEIASVDSAAVADEERTDDGKDENEDDDEFVFEPSSIFVEFLRKEAACFAAHSLHGRTYGKQTVTAGFFPYDKYLARFHGLKQP
ncbi:splicing factor U2af large subunit A-like isoform X2 [Zingiber officinale]|uniref:splicing factor U2af large subunit A-like isoform X2 n=1 Tax=Zingiber officinale TaxID=94328 RepID=UPI001C4C2817|nr:splicing factor U2af large subunit A-like isoform X2 [Zingiber officinale]